MPPSPMGTRWCLVGIGVFLWLAVGESQGRGEEENPGSGRELWTRHTDHLASCDFNNNSWPFCDWTQPCGSNQGTWIRTKHDTPTPGTGPSGDYPDGRGYFIYQEASNLIPYELNRLESPQLVVSGEACVDFQYHMFGSEDFNELHVTLLTDAGETPVWGKTGRQKPEWQSGNASLYFEEETRFKVAFDAIRGLTEYGDTAVDNVVVRRGPCKPTPTPTEPSTPVPTPTPTEPSTPASTTESTTTPTLPAPTQESCLVSGDPHYYTFDKQTHHFMGNCTYTLSRLCAWNNSLLPYFNVEASNEHRGGNTHVSYVESVAVEVLGIRVTLGKGRGVKVNGEPVIVPSSPTWGVEILPSGFYTVVSTHFGLRVKFDGDHQVEVSLSSTYKGEVCGMCGNYNGVPSDDFLNPDGEMMTDSTSLGNSWQVANLTSCSSGHDPICTEDEKDTAESHHFCGHLTDPDGPFRHCHSVLDPGGHFDGCVYDQCALHLDPGSLCRSLQSYADACQALRVPIGPWRNATFCPIHCEHNSHPEPCANACPSTCKNPNAPESCNLPCTEACVCDSGFLLYNGTCVPSHQCGCWHQGKHYPVHSSFWTDDTCTTKCSCPTRGGQLSCHPSSCPNHYYCGVQNGIPGCYKHTYGVCRVHNDPHYNTFDKQTHHFMGTCTYTLAKVCANETGLPFFNIEAKNEHRGNPSVSYVQRVLVDVYGQRIEIRKGHKGEVLVNKAFTTLPVRKLNSALKVDVNGRFVTIQTDFGLTVSYDTDDSVEIRVPTTFFNKTCGMCGNFNNRWQDDNMMPNGTQAKTSNDLGNSWQVPNAEYDPPDCQGPKPSEPCPSELKDVYKSEAYCGQLTHSQHPLVVCHATINPNSFFESCVFDLCELNGSPEALCGALEAYADACQRAGLQLPNWRNASNCDIPCDAHSHYNVCTTSCPATCSNPMAPWNCTKPCVEGCECNEGFVLSGAQCVPREDCGCVHGDQYYEKGETFWQPGCVGRCRCAENGTLLCISDSCPEDRVCKVKNGALDCHVPDKATCHIYGDPHYVTFDGRLYHFQGGCNYTAVQTCSNSSEPFSVTTRNEHRSSPHWTALNSVAISLRNLHLTLRKNKEVYVNGAKVELPLRLQPNIQLEEQLSYVVVHSPRGFRVMFDGDQQLLIQVDERFKGQLCGLCGTYSGSKLDDFQRPDGMLETNANRFGHSWRVEDDEWSCSPEPPVDPPHCNPGQEAVFEDQCRVILSSDGPFSTCHGSIPPQLYFESCVYDQCATGGDVGQLCQSLKGYADACHVNGTHVGDWQEGTPCEPTPTPTEPSTLEPTSIPTEPSTPEPTPTPTEPSTPEPTPIPTKPSTPEPTPAPTEPSTTEPTPSPTEPSTPETTPTPTEPSTPEPTPIPTKPSTPEPTPSPTEPSTPEPTPTPTEPSTPEPTPAPTEPSTPETTPTPTEPSTPEPTPSPTEPSTPETTPTPTEPSTPEPTPSPTEPSTPDPTSTAVTPPLIVPSVCTASGDPHYTTFDGRVHHFMGNCTYTLTKVCTNSTGGLELFDVSTTNEHRGSNLAVSYVNSVHVAVYGYQVSLLKNRKINVNGARRNLPVYIGGNKIVVRLSGNYVILKTNFGLSVLFDGNQYVEVAMPPEYQGQLCGLCGNFNGNPGDDNIKPDGQPAGDSTHLGNSWLVPDDNSICFSPSEICDPQLEAEIRKNSACRLIADPTGPFRQCHSIVDPTHFLENCIYDMCLTHGQQTSMCHGLQAYAASCSNAGVCMEWRNTTLCPISCPVNSHYSSCGNSCPSSCVKPTRLASCSPRPVEGCFCNEGFVLSGDMCVPETDCGCVDIQDNYYQLGESWFIDESCQNRCTCGRNNVITCTAWQCGVQENCAVQDGVLGCYTKGRASCHVVGDPHYYTFDKVMHTFLGTCLYTLVTACNPSAPCTVTPFNITGKNEDRGLRGATYLREVHVDVYDLRITLQKDKRILLNKVRAYSPVESLSQRNSVTVSNIGNYIVLETNFGLVVKYDGSQYLEVSLPSSYFSQVSGLCGNYNGRKEDELLMPNGSQAKNVTQFGNSWKVDDPEDSSCLPDTRPELGPPCALGTLPSVEGQCQVLHSAAFVPCHPLVQPELFVQTCVYDMCKYDGMRATLCAVAQAYADACQAKGVAIQWRNSTFCPLPCPPNSFYSPCGPPCPPTCSDIFAGELCEKPPGACLEGCVCQEGFVLSADQCVPLGQCGCQDDDGGYHKIGDSWLTPHCSRKCRCRRGGSIKCQDFGCGPGEVCETKKDGKLHCKPTGFGNCLITGDPHYMTFDGLLHHFQGAHSYVLSQSRPDAPERLEPFSIEGTNRVLGALGNGQASLLKELLIRAYNHTVLFKQRKTLVVDGVATVPPARPHEGLRIQQSGRQIFLESDFGLSVAFDGMENSVILLPNSYRRNIEGLCGNFDGKFRNDFAKPDCTRVKNVNAFGESWRVPLKRGTPRLRRDLVSEEPPEEEEEELDVGLSLCPEEDLKVFNGSSFCGILVDPKGPFQACWDHETPGPFLQSCLFDMCRINNRTASLCPILDQYARACQSKNVSLASWRSVTGCAPECPPHSRYNPCMSACPPSCSDLAPTDCSSPCLEGCECESGYVLSGFDCVPFRECGCSFMDKYYQVGARFMLDDCSQNCVCQDSSSLVCKEASCAQDLRCGIFNFTRGCYQADPCQPNSCLNNGTCVLDDGWDRFHCDCPENFHGILCEKENPPGADPCQPNPCLHGGTCVRNSSSQAFRCECVEQYHGELCQNQPGGDGDNWLIPLYIALGVAVGAVLLAVVVSVVVCTCSKRRAVRRGRHSAAARRNFSPRSNLGFEHD